MKYSEIKKQTEDNDKLCEQLKLVYICFKRHGMKIPFETAEKVLDIDAAKYFGLIEDETYSDRLRIENSNFFAYYLLQEKVPALKENIPKSLEGLVEVYEKATEKTEPHTVIRFSQLGQRILELLLKLVNENSDENFIDWITQMGENSSWQIEHEFLEAYCGIADELNLTSEEIIGACRQFLAWEKENMFVEEAFIPLLRRYAAQDWERGKAIFQSLSDKDRNIKNGLLSGLLKSNYGEGWPLAKVMFQIPGNQVYVMTALPHLQITSPEIGQKVLDLVLSCDRGNKLNQLNLPRTIARLINVVEFDDSDFVDRCYSELNEMAKIEDLRIFQTVLEALWLCAKKNHTQLVQTLKILIINPVIEHEHIGKLNYNPSFDNVLAKIEDVELLFTFFEEYARQYSTQFIFETFYTTLTKQCCSIDSILFREKVLNCLIHDEGSIRLFGNKILDFFSHYNHKFEFHIDIRQLPPISQYKLWMSILHPYKQPKDTIPLLLPLLNSGAPIVTEAFLCKLEELTECFHEDVILRVKQENMTHGEESNYIVSALERLKSHYAEFSRQLDEKNKIIEFYPAVSQTSALNRFNELYNSKMNESIDKGMKNSGGLISMLPKVILAKGGGWKMGNRNEIRKLGHVQTSVVMPRFYFINPEKFEMDFQNDISTNWYSDKIDFIEWIIE